MTKKIDPSQTGGRSIAEAQDIIAAGHPPIAEGVILIDFDATIAPYGYLFDYPKPYEGVSLFTRMLKANGFTIGVFTSRLSPKWLDTVDSTAEDHVDYINKYAERYGISIDFVTAEKVPALAYIDDKAITFNGDWKDIFAHAAKVGWI